MPDSIVNPRAYLCGNCTHPLGVTSDTQLFIGAVVFRRTVTVECHCCHTRATWRPGRGRTEEDFHGEYAA